MEMIYVIKIKNDIFSVNESNISFNYVIITCSDWIIIPSIDYRYQLFIITSFLLYVFNIVLAFLLIYIGWLLCIRFDSKSWQKHMIIIYDGNKSHLTWKFAARLKATQPNYIALIFFVKMLNPKPIYKEWWMVECISLGVKTNCSQYTM